MKVLIACEESQRVCIEFRKLGHEAYSCDIEPCSGGHSEWHISQNGMPIHTGYQTFSAMYLDLLRIRVIDDLFE